jgi:hypothetical protein
VRAIPWEPRGRICDTPRFGPAKPWFSSVLVSLRLGPFFAMSGQVDGNGHDHRCPRTHDVNRCSEGIHAQVSLFDQGLDSPQELVDLTLVIQMGASSSTLAWSSLLTRPPIGLVWSRVCVPVKTSAIWRIPAYPR